MGEENDNKQINVKIVSGDNINSEISDLNNRKFLERVIALLTGYPPLHCTHCICLF